MLRPIPFVSNKERLLEPSDTATVLNSEAMVFGPDLTLGSETAVLIKLVPKYIRVPVMAATLALEKKDEIRIQRPKSESP